MDEKLIDELNRLWAERMRQIELLREMGEAIDKILRQFDGNLTIDKDGQMVCQPEDKE